MGKNQTSQIRESARAMRTCSRMAERERIIQIPNILLPVKFAELASATLKQVADWFVWLASTLGRFFDERSGRSTSRKGGACYRRDARKPSAMPTNVFDKPNEQNEALFNYAMARKRRMKSNSDVPTMKSTTLPMADMMGEYRSSNKGYRDRQLLFDSNPINWNLITCQTVYFVYLSKET